MNKKLWTMLEDNETDRALVEIVQRHVRLVAEYSHKTTCLERRQAIQAEIALLREKFKQIIERGEHHLRDTHIHPAEDIGNPDFNVSNHKNNSMLEEC
ncbi:hypothetical protein [Cohnella sp.]|uniref:hypothetical protein n=1 Tax=Cohnella sp. TaxID=1883426 RepID=UPI00356423C8